MGEVDAGRGWGYRIESRLAWEGERVRGGRESKGMRVLRWR